MKSCPHCNVPEGVRHFVWCETLMQPTDHAAESKRRKGMPLFDGCMMYFPDALLAVAEFSRMANDKHNPGERVHWSKSKSNDHPNCVARHLIDIGPNWDGVDTEFGVMHAVPLAWRALATLQIAIEAKRAGMTPHAYLESLKAKEGKQ